MPEGGSRKKEKNDYFFKFLKFCETFVTNRKCGGRIFGPTPRPADLCASLAGAGRWSRAEQ